MGDECCFRVQFEQVVHIRSVREAKKTTLPTVARLSVWNTLLLPEVVFTGHHTGGVEISSGGCVCVQQE